MANLPVRMISLIAAYALASHALLSSLSPPTAMAGIAPATLAVICTSPGAVDQPGGQDRTHCAFDCTMPGCGAGGWTRPAAAVIATVTPEEKAIQPQKPAQTLGRTSSKTPQIPRAPPIV